MNQHPYLTRVATARSARPATTSQDAYAQVDRMAKSTNGQFTTKASVVSSGGRKTKSVSSMPWVGGRIAPNDAVGQLVHAAGFEPATPSV